MQTTTLTSSEVAQYARHLSVPEIGYRGQCNLKRGRVLVIGAGGLGCPALMYLAAAGVGQIEIVEDDSVDQSNLQRQVLFTHNDIGRNKGDVAKERLTAMNPSISVINRRCRLSEDNIMSFAETADVVIDATDNFQTKYLLNDACYFLGKPYVYASISQFQGQLAVFNIEDARGQRSTNLRDIFPVPPPSELAQNCRESGVLGVLPGIIGAMQASEAIKILCGIGASVINQVKLFDALTMEITSISITHRANNPLSGDAPSIHAVTPITYACSIENPSKESLISPELLQENILSGMRFQLIDVRESHEREVISLGGLSMPLASLKDMLHMVDREIDAVVYCKSGVRSAKAQQLLASQMTTGKPYSLSGGIDAYVDAGCTAGLSKNFS